MKKYLVMQGMMSSQGTGDFCEEGRFSNKKDAVKFFNSIKKNIEGYSKEPHGYLETNIQLIDDEWEDDDERWLGDNIVECYEYYWWK